ncbi:signal transduction histidine kinase [Alkalihalobacillus xiaoxiensis]|uniref:histidine kinase n=1 Tax=Shouchella xiaoxiensis TaxID=766895 RepID=A0ABS2SND0_9BACI|nr:HAMP domain-containing sensor histidine kinase [Shouchella xiaoxiensis]MBM7837033.1 signal transduction histidine kinase [Shouchella xiaoxiensis]
MNDWFLVGGAVVLLVIILVVSIKLLLLRLEMKSISKQVDTIVKQFGTNQLVQTKTHSNLSAPLITNINQLIQLYKQDQQEKTLQEKELRQEMTNISHDLRTPLTSLKGFSELLLDSNLSESEKIEYVSIILKKIDQLTLISESFYELSQLDSADVQAQIEPLSVDQIMMEALVLYHDQFEKSALTIEVDELYDWTIKADRHMTIRILSNVLANALTYATSYLTITLRNEDEHAIIRIANDVDSFDQNKLDRIFERSFRLEPSRTNGRLGLGLHIVQKLVGKQGGKVKADVQEGEFSIEVWLRK